MKGIRNLGIQAQRKAFVTHAGTFRPGCRWCTSRELDDRKTSEARVRERKAAKLLQEAPEKVSKRRSRTDEEVKGGLKGLYSLLPNFQRRFNNEPRRKRRLYSGEEKLNLNLSEGDKELEKNIVVRFEKPIHRARYVTGAVRTAGVVCLKKTEQV